MHTNKNYPQPQPQHPAAIQRHTWALTGFFFFFQFNSTLFTKHQIKTTAASSRSTTIFAALCESLFHLCSNQLHDHTSLKYILHVYQGELLVQKSVTHTHKYTLTFHWRGVWLAAPPLLASPQWDQLPAENRHRADIRNKQQNKIPKDKNYMYTVDMWTN